jgi:type II secretory pathway component PulJ
MLAALGCAALVLLSTAWFHIQAVRWGYRAQALRRELDELKKTEQILDRRLQSALSLPRLDELAKTRFGLRVPDPSQVVLMRGA